MNTDMQNKLQRIEALHLGRRSAVVGLIATVIIVPIIMLVSHETAPNSDPMFRALTPMVGILYFPIVFLISWFISYIVFRERAYKKEGI